MGVGKAQEILLMLKLVEEEMTPEETNLIKQRAELAAKSATMLVKITNLQDDPDKNKAEIASLKQQRQAIQDQLTKVIDRLRTLKKDIK
jgi:hypothetical protein